MWFTLSLGLVLFLGVSLPRLAIGQALIDCYPDANSNEENCTARGCVWTERGTESGASESAPWCTFPDGYGYDKSDTVLDTPLGYILNLNRKQSQPTIFGNDVDTLSLSVEFWDENILRLKFYDPSKARYEVPIPITPPTAKATTTNYYVNTTSTPQFGVSVIRNSTGTKIFDTGLPGFVFSDQFITISTLFPSSNVYGFGEAVHHHLLHDLNWKVWTMFARDNGPQNSHSKNMYGVQPFYINLENDGNANGVFLLNSNAMEIEFQPTPALQYWTIGGILDFYVFLGPTPQDVVKQYTKLIGYPYMPPYWGLGFQLSKYGYANTSAVQAVVDGMRSNNIPYDVQYTDIDYMDNYKDFSLSLENFADLPELIDDLHNHGQYYVPILDAAIADTDPTYYAYTQGLAYDIFVKYTNGTILEGNVWPGNSYYPDYSHPSAVKYWQEQLLYTYNNLSLEFDGIWIDMNEPSNFVVGSTVGCNHNNLNYPPYCPPILGATDGKLTDKTICMDTVYYSGRYHYDAHSLYGYFMTKTTHDALVEGFPQKRPFLFSRSNFPGSGHNGHHWLGDNKSTFEQLRDSLVGIQEYNMFGTPFVGADICGFNEQTTEELCIRWTQVGAFYSFARNHAGLDSRPQDPPSLGPRVVNASIKALTERYRLLPYLYTLLYQSHTSGSTVIRPLFHEFPTDMNTWNISFQFLWGSGLLVSPVVNLGDETVEAYFPEAKWFDYYTGNSGPSGISETLDAPLDGYIPLHVRGGVIIPTQEPSTTTTASRNNPMGMIVALDEQGKAEGQLYWDDGITYEADVKGLYNEIQYSINNNVLDVVILNNGLEMSVKLDAIKVYGLTSAVTSVTVDGAILSPSQISYDASYQVLTLTQLGLQLPFNHQIQLLLTE